MRHMRIERRQQRGAFVDEADPSVAVAMNAALVAFRVSKPAFEVEVVLWEVRVVTSYKQAWLKTRQHPTHVLPPRIVTPLELLPQGLKLHVPVVARAIGGIKRGLDCPHVCHLVTYVLLGRLHTRQASINIAGQARELLVGTPPFCASRFRCSDAQTSPKASAIRKPGGCSGPP
jgi:hypothetical protein